MMREAAPAASDHGYTDMINPLLASKRVRLSESQDLLIPGTFAAPANIMPDTSGDTHSRNSGQIPPRPNVRLAAATTQPLEYYVTYLEEFVRSQEAEHRRIQS